MIEENNDASENNILYELLIYAEWQQEPEVLSKAGFEKLEENANTVGYLKKWLGPFAPEPCPPTLIQHLTNLQMPWTFAIGGNGAVIAILQETSLEIRTSRDEYGAVIGRTQINRDTNPQWQKILWSPDCSILVVSRNNGSLEFYDLIGAHIFSIENKDVSSSNDKTDLSYSVAGMAFSDARVKNTQWSYEIIVANYHGIIKAYFISPSDGYQESHTFSLSSCISSFAYNPVDNHLIICGKAQMGLSLWRIINGAPYYKESVKTSLCKNTNQYNIYKASKQDFIFKISISPNGKILAAIHTSGTLTLWDLPSLHLKKSWPLQHQPNFSDVNPQYCEPGMKKKVDYLLSDPYYYHIVDVNWWSDEALILVRRSGAVTVSSINSLKNLLGVSPEWFEPSPAVTSFCDRGFLAVESEVQIKSKKRKIEENEFDDESSDDEDPSIFAYSADLAKRMLFFITDNDRFQPRRKKIKVIFKTYRLLCLKSTTPEELFTRKINNEEYGEALALAKTYNLDSDLVYQRQWRKMPATVESINDYLSKITKRAWVLHECLERVPESFEAAKELLMYGLRGTDVQTLVAIGKGEDHGRFIMNSSINEKSSDTDAALYDLNYDYSDLYEAEKKAEELKRTELLKQVNFKKLNLEQKQLCQCRLKLLAYLDRLSTYEIILGGPILADEQYDHNFFKKFRLQSGLEAAVNYACDSNWQAVAALFTYHGSETLAHRLSILSNFPETTSPREYQSLLPLFNEHESIFYPWDEHKLREPDWCETKYQKISNISPNEEYVDEFYERYKDLVKYKQETLTSSLVSEWFIQRAREIEERTGLVDNAFELINLGMQRNIEGLGKLYDDLMTLGVLTYECIKRDLSLKDYENLTEFDKVKLIMSTTTIESFMKHIQMWLLPFLERYEKHNLGCSQALFKSYILSMSKSNLSYIKKVLEHFKLDVQISPVFSDIPNLVKLALECVYCCESCDQLKTVRSILDLLHMLLDMNSKLSYSKIQKLQESLSNLRKQIIVAELLDKNGLSVTLSIVQNISENAEEVKKALTKLTRTASHRNSALEEASWLCLLGDILEMRATLFKCISEEDCYEIVLQSLLCSGKPEGIALAGKMLECNNKQKRIYENFGTNSFKLPFQKSVKLVILAAQEYFNASASASDPCLNLARTCLNLIEDVPASIEEELDLIASISMLESFNVNILPLQVRLCENRISLIQEALQKSEKSYKKSPKLMKLAFLLRAWSSENQEREGKVLTLIGEHAFRVKDYTECLNVCKKLISGGHKEGWLVCYSLGSCNEFNDLNSRYELMSFAITYCSDELIDTISRKKSELELQILQARVKYLVGDDISHLPLPLNETCSVTEEFDKNGLWQTGEKTLQAFHVTTQTTKAVFTSVKSVQFWKDAVNWIQPLGLMWNDESSVVQDGNKNLNKQGICAFYSGLVENAHISSLDANYERYATPDMSQSQEIAFSVLRACLIEDSLKHESQNSSVESSVLLDLAKMCLPEDLRLSLEFLLALKEPEEAEKLFKTLPSTPIVFQFACLYYALKLFFLVGINTLWNEHGNGLDPSTIIKRALDLKKSKSIEKSRKFKTLWTLVDKYHKMLFDFVQAEILHSIGGGVDAKRFASDDSYKKDTILGISSTLDDSVFHTAVSLAHHYKFPIWELYMAHLEYLFSESNVTATALSERTEKLKLVHKLLDHKKSFENRLKSCVYPSINGKDHEKLSLYFTYLEMCGDNSDETGIKPNVHKSLLNKFKAAMKSIDYKQIMSPETSESYLLSIINESIVHVFAKAASSIPKKNGGFYEPGNIYCLWIQKYFFEGNSAFSKTPTTKTEWIERFGACTDIMQRFGPSDILAFIDNVVFSDKALEKMTIDCRSDIVKRAIKFSRTKVSKTKHDMAISSEWSNSVKILTSYHQHLQRMEDEMLIQLLESYDPKIKSYCKDFDLSKSSIDKLQSLLVRITIEGPDLVMLKNFLSCCPEDIGWEPSDAYIETVKIILNQMKHPYDTHYICFKTVSPIYVLEKVLDDISKEKDDLMIEDVAVDMLNQFCQDSTIPVSIRLSVLQLLEKTGCLTPEYGDLLLLYRTQAIVSSTWPDLNISEEEIKDYSERKLLFDNLFSLSNTVNHFDSLAKLLIHWPPFPPNENQNGTEELWTKLLIGLVSLPNKEALNVAMDTLEKALQSPIFTEQCFQKFFTYVKAKGHIRYILLSALKTNYENIYKEAIDNLKETPKITPDDYNDELLDLLLKRNLSTQIITTGLYRPTVEFLLHCQDDVILDSYKSIDTVVKQLYEAGYEYEAGSLLYIKYSTHSGLCTFSSAVNILHKWLSANKL